MRDAPYQDVWVSGKPVVRGRRECEFRYYAIRNYLKKLKKPLKVLDIGANMGYFSLRLAEEFKGIFVMMEGSTSVVPSLLTLCKLNQNPQICLLNKLFSMKDFEELASKETFDVVLALSIIHHFEEPYNEVLKVFTTLGNILILEPPIPDEDTLNQERIIKEPLDLKIYKHKKLISVPAGSVFRSHKQRKTYAIECEKKEVHHSFKHSTFQSFNGIFPSLEEAPPIIIQA